MTAFNYTKWNDMKQEEQQQFPGVSIPRGHVVSNPNQGPYWSDDTAARAQLQHVETVLTGEDKTAAQKLWNEYRVLADRGFRSSRVIDKGIIARRRDAERAMGAYNGHLEPDQIEQLASVMDDVSKIQEAAVRNGIDPAYASERTMSMAASKAVGFDVSDSSVEAPLRPLFQDPAARNHIANLDQSVQQLHNLTQGLPIDALDSAKIGAGATYDEDKQMDHRRLNDILKSIPMVMSPVDVELEKNFSVRSEGEKVANVHEAMIRAAAKTPKLPEAQQLHELFNSMRDTGIGTAPFSQRSPESLGLIVGQGNTTLENLGDVLGGVMNNPKFKDRDFTILTVEGGDQVRKMLEETGRPVLGVRATAGRDGVFVEAAETFDPKAIDGKPIIEVMDLTREQAADPVARSLAANAFVARSSTIGYVEGNTMNAVEGQAIHIAGTSRKLQLGVTQKGEMMQGAQLSKVREVARMKDRMDDQQRYFTAGISRPVNGIYGVAFEGARHFEKANKKHAPDRDLIKEAYDRIPRHATIFQTAQDDGKNAPADWLKANVTDRRVLYADAKRSLTFAEQYGVGLEGEKHKVRIAETRIEIFDRPAQARQYAYLDKNGQPERDEKGQIKRADYAAFLRSEERERAIDPEKQSAEASQNRIRVGTISPSLSWNDETQQDEIRKAVRGAIVVVSGSAQDRALNGTAQGKKVAQEAVGDLSQVGILFTDMVKPEHSAKPTSPSTDIHFAHMARLMTEMGKTPLVIDGAGNEIPALEARDLTRAQGQNTVETRLAAFRDRADYPLGSDVGQLALAALPGMKPEHARVLGNSQMSIKEIVVDRSPELQEVLHEVGIPAETRRAINDTVAWGRALDRAEAINSTIEESGARLHRTDEKLHPLKLVNGPDYEPKANVIEMRSAAAFDLSQVKLAAFIGGTDHFREPGMPTKLVEQVMVDKDGVAKLDKDGNERKQLVRDPNDRGINPADVVDRAQISKTLKEFSDRGYGIAVALEEGVSRAVLEEARKLPDVKLVIVAPSNPKAATPALRELETSLRMSGQAKVFTPEHIAPMQPSPEEPARYVTNRDGMRDILSEISTVGVLVASNQKDQALHTMRLMVEADKPVAALVPNDAHTELARGNLAMLRGPGSTYIESEKLAQATVAKGFAKIDDKETGMDWHDGVRRSNAGTFQSERFAPSELMRSGRSGREFGWGDAARPLSSPQSIDRLVADIDQGQGPVVGRYVAPTDRQIESAALQSGRMLGSANSEVQEEFAQFSRIHGHDMRDTTMEHNNARRQAGLSVVQEMERDQHSVGNGAMASMVMGAAGFGR